MTYEDNGFSFVWKIENFSMLPHQFNEELLSQTFVIDKYEKVDLQLSLYPKGDDKNGYIAIYLCKITESEEVKLNFSFTIESTDPSSEITNTLENQELGECNGFSMFVNLSKVLENNDLYLPQDTLTLRCDMIPLDETSSEVTTNYDKKLIPTFFKKNCVSRTCIDVQRRSIMWSIRNIEERIDLLKETSIALVSPLKHTPSLKLTIHPNETSSVDDIQFEIAQTCLSSEKERLFAKCRITLVSAREDFPASEESSHLFELDLLDVWIFPPFLKAKLLTDESYHFSDDTLLLRCEFAFSYKDKIQHLENYTMPYTLRTRKKNSKLSNSLQDIFGDGKYSDIELKAGGKTFPYYKVLLCTRSPVFAAMFENDMEEKNSNVVEIDDVDSITVQRMLSFMHSEVLEEGLSPEDACKLYAAADKYDIDSLKWKCTAFLMSELSVESVCKIVFLADVHLDGILMTAAGEFISKHSNEVLFSKKWKSLMEDHPMLTSSVMHQILTGKYRL